MGAGIVGRGVGIVTGGIDNVASVADDVVHAAGSGVDEALVTPQVFHLSPEIGSRFDELLTNGKRFLPDVERPAEHTKIFIAGDDIARTQPLERSGLNLNLNLDDSVAARFARPSAIEDALRGADALRGTDRSLHAKRYVLEDGREMFDFDRGLLAPPAASRSWDDLFTGVRPNERSADVAAVTHGGTAPLTQTVSEALPAGQRGDLHKLRLRLGFEEAVLGQDAFAKRIHDLALDNLRP